MRILIALTYYSPYISGITFYAVRLAKALVARGHAVTVLTSQFDKSLSLRENLDGVEVVRLPVVAWVSKAAVMPGLLPQAWKLIRKADVVNLHLPQMDGHLEGLHTLHGPPLAGHGAEAVRDAIAESITTLPVQLRRSLTWDQGVEMAQHAKLRVDTGVEVYFCDPRSPWQRGTNENTNGLLRQYFPKGTNLARYDAEELNAVAAALNGRPRKTLHWKTPAEALDELLVSVQAGVANTP